MGLEYLLRFPLFLFMYFVRCIRNRTQIAYRNEPRRVIQEGRQKWHRTGRKPIKLRSPHGNCQTIYYQIGGQVPLLRSSDTGTCDRYTPFILPPRPAFRAASGRILSHTRYSFSEGWDPRGAADSVRLTMGETQVDELRLSDSVHLQTFHMSGI